MNRFRTKKKAKEAAAEGVVRGSTDSDGPQLPTIKPSKTFRLGRKQQEPEQKLELDLANALPPSDDFRTSLLMSGLSARFSMLREQDDPKSKIGKASDDSVLFPTKRQSRLNDFAFQSHGLSDIAEVSSINGSIRPPFAYKRTDSFDTTGGYGTDDDSTHGGSIMNRSKPGEGNNLFGGRQKIYKIPVSASGSSRNAPDGANSGMGGRALYGDDVSLSSFQKLRQREKEQQQAEQDDSDSHLQSGRSASPPLSGYNRNRETSSTTSSGGPSITRSSTAATSFTSQRTPSLSGSHTPITPAAPPATAPGIERTTTKARRLYETGLDQHLHEQQFSAMSRIDTLTRQRTHGAQTPPPGLSSPTGSNHHVDRWERPIAGKASMPNMRAASPSPTVAPIGNFDFGVRPGNTSDIKQAYGVAAPPLSPPVSEHDEQNVLKVQPNDRGKATAMGTFTKPAQPYDENKYSQRQLQMQQGRETPPLRKHSPPRAFLPQQPVGRNRADSKATFASNRSGSSSSAQRNFLPPDRITETAPTQATVEEDQELSTGTFLSSPNGSSIASPTEVEQEAKTRAPIKPLDLYNKYRQDIAHERPPESQHPAHRQRPFEPQESRTIDPSPSSQVLTPRLRIDKSPEPAVKSAAPEDSPTLGPTTGLSGMIHQHLRSDSNTSSIYGGVPSAGLVSRFPTEHDPMPQHDYATRNNPWDADDWDQSQSDYDGNNFQLEAALDHTKQQSVVPLPLSTRSPNVEAAQDARNASWEKDLESHHTRDGSSETQKEQQDFKMDLAARRRRVQENLKSFVETESRSASPMPSAEWTRDAPPRNNALGLLKTKTSRGSLVGRPKEPTQSKAMKMLGIGAATISSSPSPNKTNFDENSWKQEEEEMLRGVARGPEPEPVIPPQTKAFRQARRDAQRDRERQVALRHQQRLAAEANGSAWSISPVESPQPQREPSQDRVPPNIYTRHKSPSRERGPPPVTMSHRNGSGQDSQGSVPPSISGSRSPSQASRDRSGSDTSGGRSKSRGRYKDDLAKAMAEGTSSSGQSTLDEINASSTRLMPKSPATPAMGFQPSPIPSPMIGSNVGPRSRANSKSTAPGYFDSHNLQPIQTNNDMDIGISPRPSPITPFSVNSTPSLPQPSPAGSGANTPTTQGFQSQGRIPANRKRSINKSEISEPQFISSTSRITTVNLPPGSSLKNGTEINAPPIPPVNPRRKTRAMFGFGKKDGSDDFHSLPSATQSTEEMSTFSADEGEAKPKQRQKLRKISSEGGNLNTRARQATITTPSPALPSQFAGGGSPPRPVDGGMF